MGFVPLILKKEKVMYTNVYSNDRICLVSLVQWVWRCCICPYAIPVFICGNVILLIEDLCSDTHLILTDFSSEIVLHVHELLLKVQLHLSLFLNFVTQPV